MITLAIIGVVAALTIPTVVAKYQKKQYYTQFMKAFNTFSTAKNLAEAEYGLMNTWGLSDYSRSREIIKEKLFPYFKASKICETNAECGITDDLTMSYLNYVSDDPQYATTYYKERFDVDDDPDPIIITTDGAMFGVDDDKFFGTQGDLNITLDTNGVKGPNIVGRDIFVFSFFYGQPDVTTIEGGMPTGTLDEAKEDCSTEVESYGYGCAYRLLLEGKMDY